MTSIFGKVGAREAREPDATEIAALRRRFLGLPTDAVISFDVFDTMVTRIWREPSDLFLALGTLLRNQGSLPLAPGAFAEARVQAERSARKVQPSGETTLGEIYDRLRAATGIAPEVAKACADLELLLERRSIRPIAAIRDLANQLVAVGRRVVLTSDSYLRSEDLVSALAESGLEAGKIPVAVSSEHRASKRVGDLYKIVQETFPAPAYAHLGDKQGADLRNAAAAGFGSFRFCGQAPSRYEHALSAGRWTAPLAASVAHGAARAARLQGSATDLRNQTIRSIGANVAGPILSAFVGWVLSTASRAGVRRLLFLARDGQILHRLATRLVPALGLDIECRYVYGSRQALYLPAVVEAGDTPWNWLCSGMPGRTASQVLERFALSEETTAAVLRNGFGPAQVLDESAAARLRAMLETEPISRAIVGIAAERRGLARQYYASEIANESRVAIVDVGWKGRLQRCLDTILDGSNDKKGVPLQGYYFSLQESAPALSNGRASMFMPYAMLANPVLLEAFTMADHGSLLGFRPGMDGQGAEPVLACASDDEAIAWGVREQQAAVSDFLEFFVAGAELGGFDLGQALAELQKPAIANFTRFVRTPTFDEARAFGDLEHSDDQGHHQTSPIAGPISRADAVTLGLVGSKRLGRRISYWPQASLRRLAASDPIVAFGIGLLGRDRAVNERARELYRRARRALGRRRMTR
jgi:predicted HAD superfamily hydrolase